MQSLETAAAMSRVQRAATAKGRQITGYSPVPLILQGSGSSDTGAGGR